MAVPTLRFKRPDGKDYPTWKDIGLVNIFSEISEKNRTDLPVLSIKQGFGTVLRDESGINIVYSKANLKNYKAIQRDDFIIHLRSFEGGLECSRYDGISSPAYKILRCNSTILPSLYKYYFRSRNFISNKLAKAVVGIRDGKNIDMNIFWRISIPVACLEEQQRIASFIADVDEQIESYQQSLDNLEAQKKEMLRKVFSQEIRFTKEDGSAYPDWKEDCISSFGKCIAGATPSTKNPAYWEQGTIPWLSSGEVNKGQIFDTDKKITRLGYENSSTKMVKANSVIIAMAGQGKTRGTVGITRIPLCTNQSLCSIETDDTISSDYLYQHLKTRYMDLRNLSSGDGVRGGLNLSIIRGFMIQYPPSLKEQQKIADFFSDLDERIELERQRLQTMQDIKKGLLQQMFC